jgi:GNAT superfamily N-acetyltransferase
MFRIEEIGYERLEELLSLLIERANWLINRNMKMWDISKLTKEELVTRYDSPKVFLAFEDQVIVGGFLLSVVDLNYWKECQTDNAYYLHKFVVKNTYGSKGYSDKMLEWIKEFGKGKDFIRLDFVKDREYIRKLYHKHGFKEIEEVISDSGLVLIKAEYKIRP